MKNALAAKKDHWAKHPIATAVSVLVAGGVVLGVVVPWIAARAVAQAIDAGAKALLVEEQAKRAAITLETLEKNLADREAEAKALKEQLDGLKLAPGELDELKRAIEFVRRDKDATNLAGRLVTIEKENERLKRAELRLLTNDHHIWQALAYAAHEANNNNVANHVKLHLKAYPTDLSAADGELKPTE